MANIVPNPVGVVSWNPRRREREYLKFYSRLVISVAAVVASTAQPFAQDDWPNPTRKRVQQPEVPVNLLLTTLAPVQVVTPVVQSPFSQDDWANPQLRKSSQAFSLWFNSPIFRESQVSFGTPFSQEDWPNPVRLVSYRDYTWTQEPFQIPQVVVGVKQPFVPVEFPNPVLRASFRDFSFAQSPFQIAQVVIGVQSPFTPIEFPNPTLRIQGREFGWTQSQIPPVFVAAAAFGTPFYQTEHPNPVLRVRFNESGWIDFPNPGDIPANVEPVPVPVEPGVTPPSGGLPQSGRIRHPFIYLPEEVREVVEVLAKQEVEDLSRSKRLQELSLQRALKEKSIKYETRYFEALSREREILIELEIGERLREKQLQEDIDLLIALCANL